MAGTADYILGSVGSYGSRGLIARMADGD
jgi:hypothetical protein